MAAVLVTGGAGYVGSHIVRLLAEAGREVVVVDDLSEGHRAAVGSVELVESDFAEPATLDALLGSGRIDYVVHMAAHCEVGQSMVDPAAYYANNVTRSLGLLDAAVRHGVRGIVFSSSAAVYGEPVTVPIAEDHPTRPTNPYGETKLVFEHALGWYQRAHGLAFVALRYFNAAGAHPDGSIGEDHARETHLIPLLLQALRPGARPVAIFGTDYPTPDGTCVRDYVHVVDLAQAHLRALEALEAGHVSAASLNLGNGEGFSVRQVIDVVEKVTGQAPPTVEGPRRPGDPARLVASATRATELLGWRPAFPTLESIVQTAWDWQREHPAGYADR